MSAKITWKHGGFHYTPLLRAITVEDLFACDDLACLDVGAQEVAPFEPSDWEACAGIVTLGTTTYDADADCYGDTRILRRVPKK